ncbi:M81 family metallopeptidase [Roseomonas sp. 18066]|uniref:M81 family metallopeptidase n=1 Tax=Roseomonas sp. 18066 TaxID=2681412 RepID=UPI00135AD877|nr:M81 family metallopeptidase [Roseomonas sp. 18066]
MTRILVGQLWQESHDFNPVPTLAADFAVERGPAMLSANAQAGSTLGGILRSLRAAGVEAVPTLAARARPGGKVAGPVYEGFRDEILAAAAAAGRLDAVVLELHGAMTAEGHDSPEADLMTRLRALLGPGVVIAIGLDLHGHVTDALLRACDIVTACKENPHSDVVEAGERAVALTLDTLAGRLRPVTTMVKLPMLLPGGSETVDHPLAELHAIARAAVAGDPALRDVSIFNVHPFRDVADMGQAVLAIADGDSAAADRAALAVARPMWAWRAQFTHEFPEADAALRTVLAEPAARPFVLSDRGDRVLAGAPGDGLHLLQRLRALDLPLRGAFPVTDPETAAAALAAGVGAVLDLAVGGRMTPGFAPLPLRLTVLRTDPLGEFVQKGPYQAGQRSTLGACAVLRDDRGNLVLASTAAGMTQDPAAFTSQGIDLAALDLVVAKSGNHFKLSFAGIATPLVVDTPGMGSYRAGFFPYTKSRFWPEIPALALEEIRLRRFGRGAPDDAVVAA